MTAAQRAQDLIDLIVDEGSGFDNIGRRIIANRIIGVLSGWLPEEKKAAVAEIIEPMTDDQARAFGATTLSFGLHAHTPIDHVPMEYLTWLADESRKTWRNLHRYLNSPRIKREREDEDDT